MHLNKKINVSGYSALQFDSINGSYVFVPHEQYLAYFTHDELLDFSVVSYFQIHELLKDIDITRNDLEKIVSLGEQIVINSTLIYRRDETHILAMYETLLKKFKEDNPHLVTVIQSDDIDFTLKWFINMVGGKYAKGDRTEVDRAWDRMFSKERILKKTEKKSTICYGFVIHFLFNRYMLHIWLKPRFSVGFHKKIFGPKGRFFWIEKY